MGHRVKRVWIQEMNVSQKSTVPAQLDEYPSASVVNVNPCHSLLVLYIILYHKYSKPKTQLPSFPNLHSLFL